MKQITLPAYAKINLTLDITGKRQDGYHELESLMQQVSLHDDVVLRVEEGNAINIACDNGSIPVGADNIAYRAAQELLKYTRQNYKVDILIRKRIPVAGGMAGGSTDAAAVLIGLNKLLSLGLSQVALIELGVKLGADVPFCIVGRTAVARGIGEQLTPVQEPHRMWLVLVKPDFGVSTALVYKNFRFNEVSKRPDLTRVLGGIRSGSMDEIYNGMGNVLEDVTFSMHPALSELKVQLLEWGADTVMMSGSGPTMLAFVCSMEAARLLAEKAGNCLPAAYQVMVTHTLDDKEGVHRRDSENI